MWLNIMYMQNTSVVRPTGRLHEAKHRTSSLQLSDHSISVLVRSCAHRMPPARQVDLRRVQAGSSSRGHMTLMVSSVVNPCGTF